MKLDKMEKDIVDFFSEQTGFKQNSDDFKWMIERIETHQDDTTFISGWIREQIEENRKKILCKT